MTKVNFIHNFLILIFFLTGYSSLSQTEYKQNVRTYTISLGSTPQTIELIEDSNHLFSGEIKTTFTKGKWNESWFTRQWNHLWKLEPKKYSFSTSIDENASKELMNDLKEKGIETIKKCEEDEECSQHGFLDGSSTHFVTTTPTIRSYYFEEIYPVSDKYIETCELRKQAQSLLISLDNRLDFKKEFSNAKRKLPRGTYNYSTSSITFVEFHKKRKNVAKKKQ